MTAPGVGTLMGPIKDALSETFFPTIFGGKEVDANSHKILYHSVKRDGLGVPDPGLSAESAHSTSKTVCGDLLSSLLRGISLNYVGHRECIYR